jgi:hypothetical protein
LLRRHDKQGSVVTMAALRWKESGHSR